jgi:hypothetical protein
VHPLISDRLITEHFYVKHPRLQQYPEKIFNYYRMSKSSSEELLCKIKPRLLRKNTDNGNPTRRNASFIIEASRLT